MIDDIDTRQAPQVLRELAAQQIANLDGDILVAMEHHDTLLYEVGRIKRRVTAMRNRRAELAKWLRENSK